MDLLQFSKDNPPPVGTLDKGGTPFDPGKHCARVNKNTLRWIPRSPGRYNKGQVRLPNVDADTQPAPPAPAETATPAGAPQVKEVTADALLDLPPPAAPTAPAPQAESAPASPTPPPAASAPIPEVSPAAEPQAPGASAPAPTARGSDVSMAHEAAAELSARVVYTLTGVFIGDHKRATASGEEHKNIRAAFAAFYQYRGVVFVGGLAIVLVLVAYGLGDARREEVVNTFKRVFSKKPKPAPASGPVVDVEPAPAPAPAPSSSFADFAR